MEAADWHTRAAIARSLMPALLAQAVAPDTLRPEERAFLERAGQLSGEQLQLARLAIAQANSSDLRTFAQQLAVDQQQLATSIASLQRRKGANETAARPEDIVPDSYRELARSTGHGFDQAFVRMLAESHRTFVRLFEEATEDAKDLEVRALAGGALPTLRQHGNRITELTKEFE